MSEAKTYQEIREDMLRTIKYGLQKRGVDANVTSNSDFYILSTAIAQEIETIYAASSVLADSRMPDTASGQDLDRLLTMYGLSRRTASGSWGSVTLEASQSVTILDGTVLVDSEGLRYQVTTLGTYANGDAVPIRSIDVGTTTNRATGDVLRWLSPPSYCASTVLVNSPGLSGGTSDETDSEARQRLISKLRNRPGAGNWTDIKDVAENADVLVQYAFVYPAINGPSTVHVAVTAAPSDTSKSRAIADAIVTNSIHPQIFAKLPGYVGLTTTTVEDTSCDLAIRLSLPTTRRGQASAGWKDDTPWPQVAPAPRPTVSIASSSFSCTTSLSRQSSTVFTTNKLIVPYYPMISYVLSYAVHRWTYVYFRLKVTQGGSTGTLGNVYLQWNSLATGTGKTYGFDVTVNGEFVEYFLRPNWDWSSFDSLYLVFGHYADDFTIEIDSFQIVDEPIYAANVPAVTTSTSFIVRSATAPIVDSSQIAWLDRSTWTIKTAIVTWCSSIGPYHTITISTAFTGIQAGDYVFPVCTNQNKYLASIFAAFAELGPGEKSSYTGPLLYGYRRPDPTESNPYTITPRFLHGLLEDNPEVAWAGFNAIVPETPPTPPDTVSGKPKIFVPRRIGFYP